MSYANDLAVISCFYSYTDNEYLKLCYEKFAKNLKKQGIPLYVVELTCREALYKKGHTWESGNSDFVIPRPFRPAREFKKELGGWITEGVHGETILELRSPHVMWHKECLLNQVEKIVPDKYTKIAWLDCDVLIENDNWGEQASSLLDKHYAIQVGSQFDFLNIHSWIENKDREFNIEKNNCISDKKTTIAKAYKDKSKDLMRGNITPGLNLVKYHSGLAWAANRSFFKDLGLFEFGIVGGGDGVMSEGWMNKGKPSPWKSKFVKDISPFLYEEIEKYSKKIYELSCGKISCLDDTRVTHMWHAHTENRSYVERFKSITGLSKEDIEKDRNGLWKWKNSNFVDGVKKYFKERDNPIVSNNSLTQDFQPYRRKIKILHFYNDFEPKDPEQKRRHDFARLNWEKVLYKKTFKHIEITPFPIKTDQLNRDSCSMGGERGLPFLKDIFQYATFGKPAFDFYLFSNNDICFLEDAVPMWIISHYFKERKTKEMALSYKPRQIPFNLNEKQWRDNRKWPDKNDINKHPARDHGFDAFLFHKDWWDDIKYIFPDFIIGHSRWDSCMNYFCTKYAPMEQWKTQMPGLCYHEMHDSFWSSTSGKKCKEEEHNVKEFNKLKEIIYKISNLG